MLRLTERAVDAIKKFMDESKAEGLRVGIRGGGCSGLSYVLEAGSKRDNDQVVCENGVSVFIDPKSAVFLDGCELDFVKGLMETGFRVINPKATKTCGCGESFSV